MGQVTTNTQVWTPGVEDLNEPDVYLATMSASIENGIGPRLALQEQAIGLKAGLSAQVTLTTAEATMPVVINTANGNFTQGLTIAGGIVSVTTPGMYMVSGSVGIQPSGTATTTAMKLYKNSTVIVGDEQLSTNSFYQGSKATSVINCVAGDTIKMTGRCASGTVLTAADQSLSHLSVVMVQAVPQ